MQFKIKSSTLHRAVQSLIRITNPKPRPILECVLVESEAGGLRITASDGNIFATVHLRCDGATGTDPMAIRAKTLAELLATLPADETLEVTKPEGRDSVQIAWGSGRATIPEMGTKDWPKTPSLTEGGTPSRVELSQAELLHLIGATGFAAEVNEIHPFTAVIHFEFDDSGKATAVATDTRRLVTSSENAARTEGESSFNMDARLASIVKSFITESSENVRISFTGRTMHIMTGNTEIWSGANATTKFPEWKKIIPSRNGNRLSVSKESFLGAIRRVTASLKNVTTKIAVLTLGDGFGMKIESKDAGLKICSSETVEDAVYEGLPLTIGFNADSLAELIENVPTEKTVMLMGSEKTAALILPEGADAGTDGTRGIIMPLAIK